MLALLATACSGGGTPAETAPSAPVRTIVPGTPPPSPTPPPATDTDWSITMEDDGEARWRDAQLFAAGGRFMVAAGNQLRAITDKGKQAWKRTFRGDAEVSVADGVVIVTHRKGGASTWPPPNVVMGLDPANGRTLWKATSSPYGSVVGEMVYTPVCRGEQTERHDDCRLSARDARTGQVRWTILAEHVATVTGRAGGVLTMTTRPKGYRGKHWLMTLDASSGGRLGVRVEKERFGGELLYPRGQQRVSGPTYLTGGLLIMSSKKDQVKTFKEMCRLDLVALNARTGARKWKGRVRLADAERDRQCRYGLPDVSADGGGLFGVDERGRPRVVDLATGRTRWTGGKPGTILTGDSRTVLVKELVDEKETLTLYDLSSGKARWSDGEPLKVWGRLGAVLLGDRLLVRPADCYRDNCYVRVYDLSKGPLDTAPAGEYAGAGDGWVATRETSGTTTTFSLSRTG
ncbi:PQQ-binding-like beta-propeller repeat protein [Nonomuraea sp. B10E15]|uniref:outer membrane protein assembly factor BamB family protein n=1 Tax=Nonomuraea sp. B10E15 TaxID=3153560 RepID=UPI00325EF3D0